MELADVLGVIDWVFARGQLICQCPFPEHNQDTSLLSGHSSFHVLPVIRGSKGDPD